ncbi:MAG: glycosyltransferase family 4 protein [Anaerolineae bacterium]|nr:glycosyltransferase family 4 protein [Anaerolineae bacterium]
MTNSTILYLTPDFIGPPSGIARYCRMVYRAVAENNVSVDVLALTDSAHPLTAVNSDLPQRGYWPCNKSRQKFVSKALRQTLSKRPVAILVGHVNFSPIGWVLSRLINIPMVTFIYGIDSWQPLPSMRRLALQRSDQIISISRFTAHKTAENNHISQQKLRILPNCLDPKFEINPPAIKRSNNSSILTVARISQAEQYKGHDYVIQALPALLSQYPDLTYDIVGDGDGRASLEWLAGQMGVSHAVRFHGIVSDEALQQRYAEASLFIMPSRAEGFGFVFLEAMAQGIPAIGGNMDATPEVIANQKTGFIINPRSVEEIVEKTSLLLGGQSLRKQMGQAARLHVQQNFGFQSFQEKLLTYLSELSLVPHYSADPQHIA